METELEKEMCARSGILCELANYQSELNLCFRVTGGELFEDIVAREYYSEADAR